MAMAVALGDDRAVKHVEAANGVVAHDTKVSNSTENLKISRPRASLVAKRFNHFTPGNGMKLLCVHVMILDQKTPKLSVV
ncbi:MULTISPECIES: hypothetical protein [Bradyrhizobium]|jgi:hypothetical protein|uniref:hypothetical protein n=1 Tax=Bradyrhizobium TaxID=374 RepID=UPI00115FB717|nr:MULTISPECIES: hypothetical protein [Bradyrhizobium]